MGEENERKSSDLIAGIVTEAEEEAAIIRDNAKEDARRRIDSAQKRAAAISAQADREIQERTAVIRENVRRNAEMEVRRMALREQEKLYDAVTAEARLRMREKIEKAGYRDILKGWIVEAAVGLDSREVRLQTSADEIRYIDGQLLEEAGEEIRRLTGKRPDLTLERGEPVIGQGIVLSDGGGGRAFNNQVSTRLLRYQSSIRAVVYKELFEES